MMKFTLAAIVAVAHAQEVYPEYEEYEEPSFISKLFEKNEEGQWALVVPQIPQVSFSDVSEEEIEAWSEDKEEAYEAMNEKWVEAWTNYVASIETPWNDFLTVADDLDNQQDQLDIDTMEEMFTFIAENTFFDGVSVKDTYPSIMEYLKFAETSALEKSEEMNFDALRINPVSLGKWVEYEACYQDSYGYEYCEPDYQYEETPVADAFNAAGEKIADAAISYGFEPEVVSQWFKTQGQDIEAMQKEYQQAEFELIQGAVKDASDYMKVILDNAVADIKVRVEERQSQVFDDVDSTVADWKVKVDEATDAQIADMEAWIESAQEAAADFSEMDFSEISNSTDFSDSYDNFNETEYVSLAEVKTAKKGKKSSSKGSKSFYAFGTVTVGAAAGLAYYLNKKDQKQVNVDNQNLLEEDEEFVMV